jgi:hypothetical protein
MMHVCGNIIPGHHGNKSLALDLSLLLIDSGRSRAGKGNGLDVTSIPHKREAAHQ